MRAELLNVVTCIYNPLRWQSRIAHYKRFREHMLDSGVKLTVVECALGQRPWELGDDPHVQHIAVRADTLAWNKEGLINLGIQRLAPDAKYIAWIDADIEHRNRNWASDTVHSLQQYAVVQTWSEALDLGPSGEPMEIKGFHVQTSFAKVWREMGDIKPWKGKEGAYSQSMMYPHPGYSWAIRRDVLNNIGGLIDISGLGAGDHQQAMAFVGKIERAIHGQTSPEYQAAVRAWADRAYKYVQGNVGYVQGTLEHAFHGEKDLRKYHERWDVLIKHGFNPVTDIKRNLWGVPELAGNKPEMARDFDRYFRQRMEDANTRLNVQF
jgi:hypothetical protein